MELPSSDVHPILGQAVGVYRERPTPAPLAAHFSRTWFYALPSGAMRRSAIVPDGCADLVWSAGSLRIAGPDRTAKIEELPPGATVVGLRFRYSRTRTYAPFRVSKSTIFGTA